MPRSSFPGAFLGLLLLALSPAACAGNSSLDLTPLPYVRKVDGASQKVVRFRGRGAADREMMEYAPPWLLAGSGDEATMHPAGSDAVAGIYRFETEKPVDLQDEAAVLAWVKQSLPRELTGLTIERVQKDPLLLNGQCTVEVHLTYSLFGRPIESYQLLSRRKISAPTELFVFELQSQPRHFRELHRVFLASLYSLVGF